MSVGAVGITSRVVCTPYARCLCCRYLALLYRRPASLEGRMILKAIECIVFVTKRSSELLEMACGMFSLVGCWKFSGAG